MFIIRFASRYPFLTGFIHRCEDFLNRTMKVVICFLQLYFLDDSLHFPSSILLLLLAEGKRGVCLRRKGLEDGREYQMTTLR